MAFPFINQELLPLPWYEMLEAPPAAPSAGPIQAAPARPTSTSLSAVCAELALQHVTDQAQQSNFMPAIDILACQRQFPEIESTLAAAFQIVLIAWQGSRLRPDQWERLPEDVQEVMRMAGGLRRADGVYTFCGMAGPVQTRELLACVHEGLRERHERLCKAMSDIVQSLVLQCWPSGQAVHVRNLEDMTIWECAQGMAVQQFIDAIQRSVANSNSSRASLTATIKNMFKLMMSSSPGKMQEMEHAQRRLTGLLPMEERLRQAMGVVRALWRVQQQSADVQESVATTDPLQDKAFLGAVHGRSWLRRHGQAYVGSFSASAETTFTAAVNAVSHSEG